MYYVEYCVRDQSEIRTDYVESSSPDADGIARKLADTHLCSPGEIRVISWYQREGRVPGGSYGSRWGSTFKN